MWPSKACIVQVSSESSWIQTGCLQVNPNEAMQLRRKEASFMPDALLCWETGNNFLKTDENFLIGRSTWQDIFPFPFYTSGLVQVFDSLFSQTRDYLKDKKKNCFFCFFLIWWYVHIPGIVIVRVWKRIVCAIWICNNFAVRKISRI